MELTYTKHGDYYIPDIDIPAQEKVPVNRYGRMHGNYLKKNNRTAYNELLFSGRLNQYLAELGEQAERMLALLAEQYAAAENITEEMKTADAINNYTQQTDELIYYMIKIPVVLEFMRENRFRRSAEDTTNGRNILYSGVRLSTDYTLLFKIGLHRETQKCPYMLKFRDFCAIIIYR